MYEHCLPDLRLEARADALQQAISQRQSTCVRRLAHDRAEQVSFYRFLGNARVKEECLIEGLCAQARTALALLPRDVHLLAIEDTSQVNLESHAGRRRSDSGLGVIGDDQSAGFFLHPTLLVTATSAHAIGFSDVKLWSRAADRPRKQRRNNKPLPREEKESLRWVESLRHSRSHLGPEVYLSGVADCEGDAYPLFARVADLPRTGLIVRICRDRKILGTSQPLYAHLAAQPALGREEVDLRGDVRKRRSGRRAHLELRAVEVCLPRPRNWPQEAPQSGALWAVEARELQESVPVGEEPIHWRLLTTHRVEDLAQAKQIVAWYRQRWYIEQIFRLLKRDGLDIEDSELESGYALRRLAVLALGAALDVLRMLLAERGEDNQPMEQVFTPVQQECLEALAARVQGRTPAQQNPHPPRTLAWAAWIIARLAGWSGYRSQRPAGPVTYRRGLIRFALLCDGFALRPPDLCTP
jgi:hypothetical protein